MNATTTETMQDAKATYELLTAARKRISTATTLLRHCTGDTDRYGRLVERINAARAIGTYDAYTAFCAAVSGRYNRMTGNYDYADDNEFRITPGLLSTYHGLIMGRPDEVLLTAAELAETQAEIDRLSVLFETRNTTDLTDSMYGRKSWGTYHLPTGLKVSGGRDREGSLGS